MNIQVIGTKKSELTRKAERYFSERGIAVQSVDPSKRPLSEGEIDNISRCTGLEALLDTESRTYVKKGFAHMDFDIREELLADPTLLKFPIVRIGKHASVGYAPELWEAWLKDEK